MYETYKYAKGVLSGLTEEQKNYQKEVDKLNKTKAEGEGRGGVAACGVNGVPANLDVRGWVASVRVGGEESGEGARG